MKNRKHNNLTHKLFSPYSKIFRATVSSFWKD